MSAFPHATQWDSDMLNPWKTHRAGSWNAESYAKVWEEAFLAASAERTRAAIPETSENDESR
jgi:hypothetical protein